MSCAYLAHHELGRALIVTIVIIIITISIIIIIIITIIIVIIIVIVIVIVDADTPTKGRRQVVDSRALAARPGRSEEQSLRAKQERRAQLRHQMQARTNSNTLEVSTSISPTLGSGPCTCLSPALGPGPCTGLSPTLGSGPCTG